MPLGNGDVTASAWVSSESGDLRILIGKSDIFDQNSQPVKAGVIRVSFSPPLWSEANIPSDPNALKKYKSYPGLIGFVNPHDAFIYDANVVEN